MQVLKRVIILIPMILIALLVSFLIIVEILFWTLSGKEPLEDVINGLMSQGVRLEDWTKTKQDLQKLQRNF